MESKHRMSKNQKALEQAKEQMRRRLSAIQVVRKDMPEQLRKAREPGRRSVTVNMGETDLQHQYPPMESQRSLDGYEEVVRRRLDKARVGLTSSSDDSDSATRLGQNSPNDASTIYNRARDRVVTPAPLRTASLGRIGSNKPKPATANRVASSCEYPILPRLIEAQEITTRNHDHAISTKSKEDRDIIQRNQKSTSIIEKEPITINEAVSVPQSRASSQSPQDTDCAAPHEITTRVPDHVILPKSKEQDSIVQRSQESARVVENEPMTIDEAASVSQSRSSSQTPRDTDGTVPHEITTRVPGHVILPKSKVQDNTVQRGQESASIVENEQSTTDEATPTSLSKASSRPQDADCTVPCLSWLKPAWIKIPLICAFVFFVIFAIWQCTKRPGAAAAADTNLSSNTNPALKGGLSLRRCECPELPAGANISLSDLGAEHSKMSWTHHQYLEAARDNLNKITRASLPASAIYAYKREPYQSQVFILIQVMKESIEQGFKMGSNFHKTLNSVRNANLTPVLRTHLELTIFGLNRGIAFTLQTAELVAEETYRLETSYRDQVQRSNHDIFDVRSLFGIVESDRRKIEHFKARIRQEQVTLGHLAMALQLSFEVQTKVRNSLELL